MKKLLTFAAATLFASSAFSSSTPNNFANIIGYDYFGSESWAWQEDLTYTGTLTSEGGFFDPVFYTGGIGILADGDIDIGLELGPETSQAITVFLDGFYSVNKISFFSPDGSFFTGLPPSHPYYTGRKNQLTINGITITQMEIDSNLAEFDLSNLAPMNQITMPRFHLNTGLQEFTLSEIQVTGTLVSAVPEPSTYALMLGGLGLIGFMAARRRRLV